MNPDIRFAGLHPLSSVSAKAVEPDLVAMAARDIELAASDLLRTIQQATTVSEALALHGLVLTLVQELSRVSAAALDRADALCGN